jgi:XTP/dITP diphosphohydrolase
MRLVIASSNRHKIDEIAQMLASAMPQLGVVGIQELGDPPEVEESADTFAGNAVIKAKAIAAWLAEQGSADEDIVLADDSGICIDVLGGGPGVRSARFAGPDASDEDNNREMVERLGLHGIDRSPAHYICVLALARVNGRPFAAPSADDVSENDGTVCLEGRCHGDVRTISRGSGGFGYDPYFWVDEDARTFAELTQEQKAGRSHRGAAMRLLLAHLPALLA